MMGREEHGERDLKYITLTVKHGGGGVMAWARMAAIETRLLVFLDDVTSDRSSRMNSAVYAAVLSAQIQPNATKLIGQNFTF